MQSIKVNIMPYDKVVRGEVGSKLIDIININSDEIDTVCGSRGTCGKCKVKLISGNVSRITDKEKKLLSNEEIENNIILACQRLVYEDTVIEIIDYKNKDNNRLSKGASIRGKHKTNINPIVDKVFIKLDKPSLKDTRSDVRRICEALNINKIDTSLLKNLGEVLRDNNYEITAFIFQDEIIYIEGGNKERSYGITIDLGTTTVGGYLINLNSGEIIDGRAYHNKQKKYGADVISRINYSTMNYENRERLKLESLKTIDLVINELIEKNQIKKEEINIINILGNTTMSHLLMGVEVTGISKAPFNPVFSHKIIGNTKDLGLKSLKDNAKFILMPNIGGYVGSDTLSAIIGSNMLEDEGNILLLDIGTNCELALKTKDKILVCSTAAGPAFEGANMKYGMTAREGAIYDCEINEDINVKIIGMADRDEDKAIGICGTGYVSIISKLLKRKIIKSQGRINKIENLKEDISENIKRRIIKNNKSYEIILGGNITLTQKDISNLQLSKAAVRTGIELLMREGNIENIDRIYIGGAFGSNLDIESMKYIKMIPDIESENIKILGNVAGSGGIDILMNKEKYDNMEKIIGIIEHVELASHKDFNYIFTTNLSFKRGNNE